MQLERRIPRIITGVALIGALLVLLAVTLVQSLGWYRFVPVLSGSMSPYIETGDLAVLQPVDATDLTVGDVIAFEAPIGDQQLMLHRVSEIVSAAPELRIRTQGDANSSDDPWTASVSDDILWRATDKIPSLGQPVVFAHRVGAPTVIMLGGGLILFALVMRRLWVIEPDDEDEHEAHPAAAEERRSHVAVGQPAESIVAMMVVAAVVIAGIGLILARPARATFTAAAGDEQRVTFRSAATPDSLSPPTALVAQIICDIQGAPTGVELRWTQPDTPADFIGVERSSTPLIGSPEPFVELAQLRAKDETFTDDFATVDPPPSNPLDVRYRVRSGSKDGRFSAYSNIASVEPCIPTISTTTTTVPITTVTTIPPTTTIAPIEVDPTPTSPLSLITDVIG